MYCIYILWNPNSKNFYYGYTANLRRRLKEHQRGLSKATAPYKDWRLLFYAAFANERLAKGFEQYLKSGSGKAFAYKRFVDITLAKDGGGVGIPKL